MDTSRRSGEVSVFFPGIFALALLLACSLTATAGEPNDARRVVRLSGDPFAAELRAIDAEWNVTLHQDGNAQELPAADLVTWGARYDVEDAPLVLLRDGSLLAADVLGIRSEQLRIANELWGEVALPVALLRGVIVQPPAVRLERDRLIDRMSQRQQPQDEVLLDNGDKLTGRLTDLDEDQLRLRVGADEVKIRIEQVAAVALGTSPRQTALPDRQHVLVGFRDGSLLRAYGAVLEGRTLKLTLSGGTQLDSDPLSDAVEDIVSLQPVHGGLTYLSDLQPLGYKHVPFLSQSWSYGVDRSVAGGWLRAGQAVFSKGLGMHSAARLAYQLDGKYATFSSELAIDAGAGQGGSVIFRVFLDEGQGGWRKAFESPVIRGGEAPVPVSVDVATAQRLALLVDFADRGDIQDHANWLNARLQAQ